MNPFKLVKFDISPTSAAHLPDGNILIWVGATKGSEQQDETALITNYQIINTDGVDIGSGFAQTMNLGEMFCTGTSKLPDGNILINGGSNMKSTILFNYNTSTFTNITSMGRPRGYNANCVTTDNRIFTLGGEWGPQGDSSTDYYGEIIDLNTNEWVELKNVSGLVAGKVDKPHDDQSNQNHMWIFPFKDIYNNHRVFKAGPSPNMHIINLKDGTMKYAGKRGSDKMGIQGTAVQYEPGKILTLSGTMYQDNQKDNVYMLASKLAFIIDMNPMVSNMNAIPIVSNPINRIFNRVTHNAVIIPGGNVIVIGGQTNLKKWNDKYGVLQPELYDPTKNMFTLLNYTMKYSRNYHSVALLLKDGRVLIAGGGSGIGCETYSKSCNTHFDGEIFTPPYLIGVSNSNRPIIESVKNNVSSCIATSLDFTVKNCNILVITIASNTCGIQGCSFDLIRLSSVTHSINNDQLRIPLTINSITNNKFKVSIDNKFLPFVVSGNYYLFAINNSTGVPSIGKVINIKRN